MDICQQALEYPAPILAVGVKELTLEAQLGQREGTLTSESFSIKNSGGGLLEGRIISPTKSLTFRPAQWESNQQEIFCSFYPDAVENWKPGDVRIFSVLILSNGGNASLSITTRMAKTAIHTSEGAAIANLHDFYAYFKSFPEEACSLFADSKFYMLLMAIEFPYIKAYTLLTNKSNRIQSLDNFFVLADIKKRTTLLIPKLSIEHRTLSNAMIHGHFIVQKSDDGYIEALIKSQASWLCLAKKSLTIEDFTDNATTIRYSIDPLLITGRYAQEKILIETDREAETANMDIIFKRPVPLKARLSREGYRYSDEGTVILENQTDKAMQVEVFCKESFVRFHHNQYKVVEKLEIPFIIKLSPLQFAQMMFRKVPSLFAEIQIKATYKGLNIKKNLTLTAGQW